MIYALQGCRVGFGVRMLPHLRVLGSELLGFNDTRGSPTMTLRLVTDPPSPGQRLARLLTANHADGTNTADAYDTRACEPPLSAAGSRLTVEQRQASALARQDDGWWCDPSWDRHGLAWWYPHVAELVGVRTTSGRAGGGGAVAVPIDLGALDFVDGQYWALDEAPTERTMDDPDSYRLGFVPTVIELEKSARRALRLAPRPRPKAEGYDGLGLDGRVTAALEWMAAHAEQLVDEAPMFAETVRSEALRLLGRSSAMVMGNRFTATVNACMYCTQTTVVADEDRAVCINPDCRRDDGSRWCWRYDSGAGTWIEADEPDVRGRGQLADDQLPKPADLGRT
jgi:hypothetical protein